jgi:membrane protein YqaA with SNARE-associated domain
LDTLKHILSRYTGFLWTLLQPLGIWGVFVISGIDAAAFGLPMDIVVASYVYQRKSPFLLYVILAAAGSALGSSVLYLIGYTGGEKLLRKRMSPAKFGKIHRSFDQHEFWALMFPAMLPPPVPFKLFVLSAAAFEMNFGHFLLAIFAGRFVRFLLLSLLTLRFGPNVVAWTGDLFTRHSYWIPLAAALALGAWLMVRRIKNKPKPRSEQIAENASQSGKG